MQDEVFKIFSQLEHLEDFYREDYIDLRTYYKIKENILLKFIAIGEAERSEIMEKIENEQKTNY